MKGVAASAAALFAGGSRRGRRSRTGEGVAGRGPDPADVAAPALLLLCLFLGGSSGGGLLANALLQIAAGATALWLVWRGAPGDAPAPARALLILAGVAAGWIALTLVPLPPALWAALPGRGVVADGYDLLGMAHPWAPLSLAPDASIALLLSFIPPVAMFLAVVHASPAGRRAAVLLLAGFAFLSVLVGVAQQVGGPDADLFLYADSGGVGAVGFFANRNHLATLCLMTLPFLAAFAARGRRSRRGGERVGGWTLPAAALALLAVGALLVQSRAGVLLLFPTSIACLLVFRGRGRSKRALAIGVAATAVAAASVLLSVPASVGELSLSDIGPRERLDFAATTWRAALDFLPFGAGPGSFDQVYPLHEDLGSIRLGYVNHAHDDYLELLLEAGLVGAALLGAFLFWWVGRIRAAWGPDGGPFTRAAVVAVGVVLAHGLVDYPIRTAAIAAVAALACAVAASPEPAAARGGGDRRPARGRDAIMLGRGARAASLSRLPSGAFQSS